MPVPMVPQYDIAVIIVNYNVKSFLNFCLESIYAASQGLRVQIIVVDNASTDGSILFLKKWHKSAKIISSLKNEGFAKGCNKGYQYSNAKYVLFLNPDTILSESVLRKCTDYYEAHKNIGAIGVKMIDGSGKFLPESKRGKITPRTALFKQIGLSKIFPKSPLFNQYYLGHLNSNKIHNVSVLTGAFFFTSSDIIDKLNGFDEQYFMYAEDIDLSYRIEALGKKLIYFPASSIIHFKGESTEKSTIQYFDSFYGSMKLFVDKHYSKASKIGFNLILSFGILINGILTVINRILKKLIYPILDVGIIATTLVIVANLWARYYHGNVDYYNPKALCINVIIYTSVWSAMLIMNGVYHKRRNISLTLKAIFHGLFIILMIYALLGNAMRSSRAIILIGFVSILIIVTLVRFIINTISRNQALSGIRFYGNRSAELDVILNSIGYKSSIDNNGNKLNFLFSIGNIKFTEIIKLLEQNKGKGDALFWDEAKQILISSSNKRERGLDIDENSLYQINRVGKIFTKRIFDIVSSLIMLLLIPIIILFSRNISNYTSNLYKILIGNYTFFSYMDLSISTDLPKIKTGYFPMPTNKSNEEQNLMAKDYALHYSFLKDVTILLSYFYIIIQELSSKR